MKNLADISGFERLNQTTTVTIWNKQNRHGFDPDLAEGEDPNDFLQKAKALLQAIDNIKTETAQLKELKTVYQSATLLGDPRITERLEEGINEYLNNNRTSFYNFCDVLYDVVDYVSGM